MGDEQGSSDLGRWIRRLRSPVAHAAEAGNESDVVDTAIGWAAEHARRYVASDGSDDGWDGPRPIVVLYTTGRRSGRVRRNPVLCFEDGDERYVVASYGGAPTNPAWYDNLVTEPNVTVQFGAERYAAVAVTLAPDERAALWPRLVDRYPMFAEYQATTERTIPVVQLRRTGDRR